MSAISAKPDLPVVTSGDRLALTLFLAVVIHAIVILGLTFSPDLLRPKDQEQPPMEITLVHQSSEEEPEDAEVLAQTNLVGGGTSEQALRPSSPASTPILPAKPGETTEFSLPTAPPPSPQTKIDVVHQTRADRAAPTQPTQQEQQPVPEAITAAELVAKSMEIAHLSAEINESLQAYAERKRHRYISTQAKQYRDAAYLDAWRAKVERVGNLNYPEEAKRQNISGSLILEVVINADGSLDDLFLRRSSGHKVLDDAAMRIVRLAAPFAPFPPELAADTDVLHITRTWQFLDEHRLTATQ